MAQLGKLDPRPIKKGDVFKHIYTDTSFVFEEAQVLVPVGGLEIGAVLELTTDTGVYHQVDSTTVDNAVAVLAESAVEEPQKSGGTFPLAVGSAKFAPVGVGKMRLSFNEDSAFVEGDVDKAIAALEASRIKVFDQI